MAQKALVHKQFNSPIGLYSDRNVKETLNRELRTLSNGTVGIDFENDPVVSKPANLANSAVLRMLEEEERQQRAAGQNPGLKRVAWPPPSDHQVPVSAQPAATQHQQQYQQPQYPAQDQSRAVSQPPLQQQQQHQQQQSYHPQPQQQQGVPIYQRSFEKGNQSPRVTTIPISVDSQQPSGGANPPHIARSYSPARPVQQQHQPQYQTGLAPKPAVGLRGASPTVSFSGGIACNKPVQKPYNDYYITQQQPTSYHFNDNSNANDYQQQQYQQPQQQQQQQQQRACSQPAPAYCNAAPPAVSQQPPQQYNSQSSIPGPQYQNTGPLSPSAGYGYSQPSPTSPRGWSHVRASTPTTQPQYHPQPHQQPPSSGNNYNQSFEVTPSQTSSFAYPQSPSYNQTSSPGYGVPQQQFRPSANYGQQQPQYYPEQNSYNQQPQQQPQQQQQFNSYSQPSPGTVTLRTEVPVTQKPAPVYQSQPPVSSFKGGANMRGDQKWPPEEYKVAAAAENEARLKLAAGPACRPRRVNKDYSGFFARHALNSTYPGYKVPPGTQHYQTMM